MEGPINLESKDNHNIIKYNSHVQRMTLFQLRKEKYFLFVK
jgi:hypothetical protein